MVTINQSQATTAISALKLKASRKKQQLRNFERRKVAMILEVGEEEFNHRISLRQKDIAKAETLIKYLQDVA